MPGVLKQADADKAGAVLSPAQINTLKRNAPFCEECEKCRAGVCDIEKPNHDTEKITHDLVFVVNDEKTGKPKPNTPYQIKLESGLIVKGVTDSKGLTQKVSSNKPEKATIEAPYYGDTTSDTHSDCGSDACSC
jgi:type VI secretion system secreted protein VgrG